MPVREGRWVPWAAIIAAEKAAKAAAPVEVEDEPEAPAPPAKRTRRSKAAAEAAIAEATGVNVTLDEPVVVEDLPDISDTDQEV